MVRTLLAQDFVTQAVDASNSQKARRINVAERKTRRTSLILVLMVAALLAASLMGVQSASAQSTSAYWGTDYCYYYAWNGAWYRDGCYRGVFNIGGVNHQIYEKFRGSFTYYYSYQSKYSFVAVNNTTGEQWFNDGTQWYNLTQLSASQNTQSPSDAQQQADQIVRDMMNHIIGNALADPCTGSTNGC